MKKNTTGLQIRYSRNSYGFENTESFFDLNVVREYRRVIGTLAFPYEEKNGSLMIVAEAAHKAERLGYSYYILAKYSHISFDSVLKKMIDFQNIYHVRYWYTNTNNNLYMHLVDSFNLCRPATKKGLCVLEAPFAGEKRNLTVFMQQIKSRLMQNKKTLFIVMVINFFCF